MLFKKRFCQLLYWVKGLLGSGGGAEVPPLGDSLKTVDHVEGPRNESRGASVVIGGWYLCVTGDSWPRQLCPLRAYRNSDLNVKVTE